MTVRRAVLEAAEKGRVALEAPRAWVRRLLGKTPEPIPKMQYLGRTGKPRLAHVKGRAGTPVYRWRDYGRSKYDPATEDRKHASR